MAWSNSSLSGRSCQTRPPVTNNALWSCQPTPHTRTYLRRRARPTYPTRELCPSTRLAPPVYNHSRNAKSCFSHCRSKQPPPKKPVSHLSKELHIQVPTVRNCAWHSTIGIFYPPKRARSRATPQQHSICRNDRTSWFNRG